MMMPMSVMCHTCGEFIYKGTKFVMRKENVIGETYLGIQIFRFAWRCPKCSSELSFVTDPKNHDYLAEKGCKRTYEPWKAREQEAARLAAAREETEAGNAMKALENRTLDSKREMDILAALDEARALNSEKHKLDLDQLIARHAASADTADAERAAAAREVEREAEDREVAELLRAQRGAVRRIGSDEEGDEAGGSGEGTGAGAGPGAPATFAMGDAGAGGAKGRAGARVRVRVKSRLATASGAAGAAGGGQAGAGEGAAAGAPGGGEAGAGLGGLLGAYGSDSDASSG